MQTKIEYVSFDLKQPHDQKTLIKLVMAKDLFQTELPRMPKDYITRLIFNPHHETLMLFELPVKENVNPLVGGICYRKFPEVQLIEIAFCAVSGVKKYVGHGALMMNALKEHLKDANGIQYTDICTYADNSAIEYFSKQGFSQNVAMPEEVWLGRIKHYEGAKFMHCPLYDISYSNLHEKIQRDRNLLLQQFNIVPQKSSQILDINSLEYARKYSQQEINLASSSDVKFCCDAAKTAIMIESGKEYAIPFLTKLPDVAYCSVVENNLQLMAEKASNGFYRTRAIFREHAKSIHERCESYNGEKAEITQKAKQLVDGLLTEFDKIYNHK